jgi:hypothetical protein
VTARVERLQLFGPAPVFEGEDAAAYDELLARTSAAVKPVDMIDEIHLADVVPLEWEILRLRRLKLNLVQQGVQNGLEQFLREKLEYHLYWERFVDDLAKILKNNLPEDQVKNARALALELRPR